jgi:hypothetical protein
MFLTVTNQSLLAMMFKKASISSAVSFLNFWSFYVTTPTSISVALKSCDKTYLYVNQIKNILERGNGENDSFIISQDFSFFLFLFKLLFKVVNCFLKNEKWLGQLILSPQRPQLCSHNNGQMDQSYKALVLSHHQENIVYSPLHMVLFSPVECIIGRCRPASSKEYRLGNNILFIIETINSYHCSIYIQQLHTWACGL